MLRSSNKVRAEKDTSVRVLVRLNFMMYSHENDHANRSSICLCWSLCVFGLIVLNTVLQMSSSNAEDFGAIYKTTTLPF